MRMSPAAMAVLRPLGCSAFLMSVALAPAYPQSSPPPHPLGPTLATSVQTFQQVSQIVPLSDGRLFVADRGARVVQLLDPTLSKATTVLDSAAGRANSFSANSFLMPFHGDSSLFYDKAPTVFVVIGPSGALGRVLSAPTPPSEDALPFWAYAIDHGSPGWSGALGVVYSVEELRAPYPPRPAPGQPDIVIRHEDSVYVVRWNPATRVTDTVTKIGTGVNRITTVRSTGLSSVPPLFSFAFYDELVVTTDGSIAIFHAREGRLEWYGADRARVAGTRLPFPWRRIADDERAHIVDSVNTGKKQQFDSAVAKRAADSIRTGAPPMTTIAVLGADGIRSTRQTPAPAPRMAPLTDAQDVPDFYPPTTYNAVFADGDNHVWIRERPVTLDSSAPPIWQIVGRNGEVIDRVRIPLGQTIIGFGSGGIVYSTVSDGGVVRLLKSRVK